MSVKRDIVAIISNELCTKEKCLGNIPDWGLSYLGNLPILYPTRKTYETNISM
jgi:hypothetical protein